MSGWDSEFRVNIYSVKSGVSHHYTVVENTKQVLKNSLRFYSISIWQVLFQEGPFLCLGRMLLEASGFIHHPNKSEPPLPFAIKHNANFYASKFPKY